MADTELSTAQRQLAHGSKYPYDGGSEAAPAIDWAHAAARGVMADLLDRRGVKWELEKVDIDVRADIVTAVAAIVRAAAPLPSTAPVKDHVVREVVNRLRDTALEFHAHGSLRERLARELEPLLAASTVPDRGRLVRQFLRAACPCCTSIDARGYQWCEAYLDEARAAALASRPAEEDDKRHWVVVGGRRAGRTFLAALARDAERYRWMRNAQWFKAGIAKTELNASSFHYSGDLLDQLVDAGRAAGEHGEGAGK